jgi:hypothetical protein
MSLTTVQGGMSSALVAGTAVATTSGTSIDFTSIPSWVKRITVMFNAVSTNSTSLPQIQLGTSSGIETAMQGMLLLVSLLLCLWALIYGLLLLTLPLILPLVILHLLEQVEKLFLVH